MRDVRRIIIGGRRGLRGGPGKEWMGCFLDDLRAFGINADNWMTAAQGEGEWRRTAEQKFHGEMNRCRERKPEGWTTACSSRCPNVTGRSKKRIAQSKRAHVGSLAVVD